MKELIRYFIKYPFAGNLLAVVFMLLGWFGLMQLNSTTMPQVDPGMVTISASYPGASPEEVEKGVVLKIEDNLKGVSGIDKITSSAQENGAIITAKLTSGYDSNLALQDVKNAVDGISSFPVGVENISVKKVEFKFLAMTLGVSGDMDLRSLKSYARKIENDIRAIDGISKVALSGFPAEEIEVSVDEEALKSYRMSFDDIYSAVKDANIDKTGGTIRGKDEELRIRIRDKEYYAQALQDIVVRSGGVKGTVRLSDVASVNDKWSETPDRAYIDGNPAIIITISHTVREDILNISDQLNAYVDEFNSSNGDVKMRVLLDNSVKVGVMQDLLVNNGLMGFVLVLLFLSLFLNHRLSFWVALGIPISFMGMFMVASMYGLTLNKISLFGMILVIGILVDDGIVIAENIFQHYERGKSAFQAGIDGTMEVLPAVFSAVLTTIVAFSAFFFIDGLMGQFFQELAFVVIFALVFSLVEAFLILPGHVIHSKALAREKKESWLEKLSSRGIILIRKVTYEPVLRFCLNNKMATISMALGMMAMTIGAYKGGIIISGDNGVDDKDYVNVTLDMPSGTPEGETFKILERIERGVDLTSKAFKTRSKTGDPVVTSIRTDLGPANKGKVTVYLLKSEFRDFLSSEFSNVLRKNVGEIAEAERVNYIQESHFGRPVSVSLQSSNLQDLEAAKEELKLQLSVISGLKNVVDNDQVGMREVKLSLKESAYKLGLTLGSVTDQVRTGFFGREVQRLQRGLDEVRVWVRYEKDKRSSVGDLENMRIRTKDGGEFLLKDVVWLDYERNLVKVNHLNGQREITVEADITGSDVNLGKINEEINNRLLPDLEKKYPGLNHRYGGKREEQAKAMKSALLVAPAILVLLLSIVIFTFRSVREALMVFSLIPLGFIGVGWGHWLHGIPLDMPSYLGMVALMGVMVNDSIVMISTINDNLRNGINLTSAIYDAAVSRFRPIVLTSLTTIVGLGPLIAVNSPEANMVIPMAISLAYGLAIATFLNLILLPVLAKIFIREKALTPQIDD